MWTWIVFYSLLLSLAQHMGNLLVKMFRPDNIVRNPLVGRKQYSYRDEVGILHNCPLWKGRLLSIYCAVFSLAPIVLAVVMWFFAEWWQCLIALTVGLIVRTLFLKAFTLRPKSSLYYIELAAIPVCLALTVYFLTWY